MGLLNLATAFWVDSDRWFGVKMASRAIMSFCSQLHVSFSSSPEQDLTTNIFIAHDITCLPWGSRASQSFSPNILLLYLHHPCFLPRLSLVAALLQFQALIGGSISLYFLGYKNHARYHKQPCVVDCMITCFTTLAIWLLGYLNCIIKSSSMIHLKFLREWSCELNCAVACQ